MKLTLTEAEYDEISWHDCHLWGVELRTGESEDDDWTAEVVFRIDYIVEWLRGEQGETRFRIAPATLVFHGVTDLRMTLDCGQTGFQVVPPQLSINRIHRERVVDQKVFLDRPYYSWRIELNAPTEGTIQFGAVGFTQTLLADPVESDRQHLSLRSRNRPTTRSS